MPSVIINEKDYTITNVTTNVSNNIVYIPGIASTGPSDPTLIRDYNTFVATFGANPDTSSITANSWEYAASLLLEGFPVLFHRVSDIGETSASVDITTGETPDPVVGMSISSKYAGTDGNSLIVTLAGGTLGEAFTVTATVGIVGRSTVLETVKICDVGADVTTDAELFALIANAIDDISSDYIKFDNITPEGATFALPSGWATTYTLSGGTNGSADNVITKLNSATFDSSPFGAVVDKDLYSVKFITSGGFIGSSGSDGMYLNMKYLAETRGDCTAFFDAPKDGLTTESVKQFFGSINSSYTTWLYPWARFGIALGSLKWVTPSFAWMFKLAQSVSTGNPAWMPPAGVNRGLLTEAVELSMNIGGTVAEDWYNNTPAINPIRQIRNYGYAIYGQKTMYSLSSGKRSAFQDLNVRLTANEIKKYIDEVAVSLTFEGNNYTTWMSFYTKMDAYLTSMKASGGIEAYEIIMDNSVTSEEDIANNVVRGIVRVQITRMAEDFVINFEVVNNIADYSES